ncbi:MAG TPA: HD domain-containing phosphohydrolase [Spirochaetia bacterium]|nr:HD domain-containing phosphohydrolase [Spirochaetia bacterium]
MSRSAGLRARAIGLILPVVIGIVVVSGFASSFSTRTALLRVATRLMAFKTEQVRDFAYSQSEMLDELGYADDPDYRMASDAALQSYATSLVRSPTEKIFALGTDGEIAMATSLIEPTPEELEELIAQSTQEGWFEASLEGVPIVGEVFSFAPNRWRVFVTEQSKEFYGDVRRITVYQSAVLAGGVAFAVIAMLLFVGYALNPLVRLTAAMRGVSESLTFDRRIPVESDDEIGTLAEEFNTMLATVQISHERLHRTIESLTQARKEAAEREEETLLILGAATEFRDMETGAHILRVGRISALLARLAGFDPEFQELMLKAAPLHDVGKIGIPDSILLKPGPLTDSEMSVVRQHPLIGWRILQRSQSVYLKAGAEIALSHHECWNGSGYPSGLAGTEIPISGRIVGIADVYDALRSDRPYKTAMTHEAALETITDGRGTRFDPELLDLIIAHEDDVATIGEVIGQTSLGGPQQIPSSRSDGRR